MKQTEVRLEELADQIYALQLLLMSHIAACDLLDDPPTLGTFEIAQSQIDSLIESNRLRVAIRLQAICDELREVSAFAGRDD